MEAVATLLNTLVSRILFGHFTMFLVFLFVGFAFMPPEWALYLNAKTPAFFPDWFTLANFGSFVLACVATMIWILFCNVVKWLWKSIDNYCYPRFKRWKAFRAWEEVYATLSPREIAIIRMLMSQDGAPLELKNNEAESLVAKQIIQVKLFHPMFNAYLLTPSFRAFLFNKYQQKV